MAQLVANETIDNDIFFTSIEEFQCSIPRHNVTDQVGLDATGMYVNVNIPQLRVDLQLEVSIIFHEHLAEFLLVSGKSKQLASWRPMTHFNANNPRHFNDIKLKESIDYLLQNMYVQFAGTIRRQLNGIAMGYSTSPIFSRVFCSQIFLRAASKHPHLKTVYIRQGADDLYTSGVSFDYLAETLIPEYQSVGLELRLTSQGPKVEFFDLTIILDHNGDIHTKLFSKADSLPKAISIHRYPDHDTLISETVFRTVVASELLRIFRRSTSFNVYALSVVNLVQFLVTTRKYPGPLVIKQLRRHLNRLPTPNIAHITREMLK